MENELSQVMIKNPSKTRVVVGMSGGVDSSVTALLLHQQGYEVIGLFMKNWEEEGSYCPAATDYEDALSVAQKIGIPLYSVNFAKEYWDQVFSFCLKEFEQGFTPNPDILCNREIKFNLFLRKAKELGAKYIATGHYCQNFLLNGENTLCKAADTGKDQSYFLYTINKDILKDVLFPIGHLLKKEVREIALKHNLATAQKKDSTGICFIGKRDFPTFLSTYLKPKEGNFETLKGKIVGKHTGAQFYTIGQRKGLGIGGEGEAWFVVGKDMPRNVVFVEQGENHPALFKSTLFASDLTWVSKVAPQTPYTCRAKIRYRQEDQKCIIESIENGIAKVSFTLPQRAVTSRQSVVFYQEGICLGGGMIV